jgi:hypothetical protein
VCPLPSQYSGGRPGPAAAAAGWSQPGYWQVRRVVAAVLSLAIGGVSVHASLSRFYRIRFRIAILN